MLKTIIKELRHHAPFTLSGAAAGVSIAFLCKNVPYGTSYKLFYFFHPLHVVLSALVTTSMYNFHRNRSGKFGIIPLFLVGYIGSVGIATLSDSIIPYFGEALLNMPHREAHIGFLEEWWIVNPLAIIGILMACFRPSTKLPHSAHIFVSTAASLFHILMAKNQFLSAADYLTIFFFLFIAVWVPCCTSDIVFPLLFIKSEKHRGHF